MHELAKVLHAADVTSDHNIAPEAVGLKAIATGFGLIYSNDYEILEKQFPIYNTLYAYYQLEPFDEGISHQ